MSELPQVLSEGIGALRDGDPAKAASLLAVVANDDAFAAAPDLQDIRLRVLTLYAQALLESGRASEARHPLYTARELVESLGVSEAAQAIAELETRIGEAISARFAAQARARTLRGMAARSVDELLAKTPEDRHASVLVERAAAALEVGHATQGATIARRALQIATTREDLRHQVMAILALSRAEPDRCAEHLEEARRRTDEADAFDLLAFVVKAAEEAQITLTSAGVHQESDA